MSPPPFADCLLRVRSDCPIEDAAQAYKMPPIKAPAAAADTVPSTRQLPSGQSSGGKNSASDGEKVPSAKPPPAPSITTASSSTNSAVAGTAGTAATKTASSPSSNSGSSGGGAAAAAPANMNAKSAAVDMESLKKAMERAEPARKKAEAARRKVRQERRVDKKGNCAYHPSVCITTKGKMYGFTDDGALCGRCKSEAEKMESDFKRLAESFTVSYSAKDCKAAGYSAGDCKAAGYSAKDCEAAGYSLEDIVSAFDLKGTSDIVRAFGLRKLERKDDSERRVGARVLCEGKLGKITEARDGNVWNLIKIAYDDGTKNKAMFGGGYLVFTNRPDWSGSTEDVWVGFP